MRALRTLAAVVLGLLGVVGTAHATTVDGGAVPVALAGDRAYTLRGDARRTVAEVDESRSRDLLRAKDLRSVSASESLVVVGSGRDGGTEAGSAGPRLQRSGVLAAAPGEPPRAILRCGVSPLGFVAPVAAGPDAAYRSCDGGSIVAGARTIPTGGPVVALAAVDRRLAWLESRGTAPGAFVTLDLDTAAYAETPLPEPLGVAPAATLAIDRSGRARVTQPVGGFSADCRTLESTAGGPFATVADTSCEPKTLLDDGVSAVGVVVADDEQQLTLTGALSRVIARVAGERPIFQGPPPPGAATDGTRIAFTRRDCRANRLTVATPAETTEQAGLPSCPLRILTRAATLSRRGTFRATVRCPRGCRVTAADVEVAGDESVEDAGGYLVPDDAPSRRGRATFRVGLNSFAADAVADRGTTRIGLRIVGFDGRRETSRVRLRAR